MPYLSLLLLVLVVVGLWYVFTKAGETWMGRHHPVLQHLGGLGGRRQAGVVAGLLHHPYRQHSILDHSLRSAPAQVWQGSRNYCRADIPAVRLPSYHGV